ncbi:MAG: L-fuculose-phosphate aldolase [Moorella sp. (in: firmicutes)]|uniref:class II aldolase/adducin family protein n=1 Tax=unclassified Neomoorella TaxID=2676739 RepID=UPI0010FFBA02|nr:MULTISPECIES: class II aldolase/adducin family protein [unclassified Moorella (in: firmicutes)]MDK2817147.1 L-fuculose-phosphate aldolase [Moorella sp. (in: firmicutes)]GEA14221.1 aldolase [Moorella sp. E308F]GEA18394.1 aldolase [Moorella sp. E306M]
MASEYQIRQDICEVGRRIYAKGFVASNDGNISVRIGENEVLTTPTGVSKGFMTPDMIIKVDLEGRKIAGNLKPSSEIKMHLDVYRHRPDVRAVVHAHPPVATAFAVAGIPLDKPVLPEIIITLGAVPIAKYGTPSTEEIPLAVREYLDKYDAVLLENHGALTMGTDVYNAFYKMESIEHFAKISLAARQLGGERVLPCEEVEKLLQIREKLGVSGRHPGCTGCGACSISGQVDNGTSGIPAEELQEIISAVTRRVLASLRDRKQ